MMPGDYRRSVDEAGALQKILRHQAFGSLMGLEMKLLGVRLPGHLVVGEPKPWGPRSEHWAAVAKQRKMYSDER